MVDMTLAFLTGMVIGILVGHHIALRPSRGLNCTVVEDDSDE